MKTVGLLMIVLGVAVVLTNRFIEKYKQQNPDKVFINERGNEGILIPLKDGGLLDKICSVLFN